MLPHGCNTYLENFKERGITKRQLEVISLIMEGWSNNAIAAHLCIETASVIANLTKIYKTLPEVRKPKRLNLVLLAQRGGKA